MLGLLSVLMLLGCNRDSGLETYALTFQDQALNGQVTWQLVNSAEGKLFLETKDKMEFWDIVADKTERGWEYNGPKSKLTPTRENTPANRKKVWGIDSK